jgi:hypothetical protein
MYPAAPIAESTHLLRRAATGSPAASRPSAGGRGARPPRPGTGGDMRRSHPSHRGVGHAGRNRPATRSPAPRGSRHGRSRAGCRKGSEDDGGGAVGRVRGAAALPNSDRSGRRAAGEGAGTGAGWRVACPVVTRRGPPPRRGWRAARRLRPDRVRSRPRARPPAGRRGPAPTRSPSARGCAVRRR